MLSRPRPQAPTCPYLPVFLMVLVGACTLDRGVPAISGAAAPAQGARDAASRSPEPSEVDADFELILDGGADPADAPHLAIPDAGEHEMSPDAGEHEASPDAASCTPTDEACNAEDDDCDGDIDEDACDGCEQRTREGVTYQFCSEHDEPWQTARDRCLAYGYDLVVLEEGGEDRWAWQTAEDIAAADWWIGLSDLEHEGRFVWVDDHMVWQRGDVLGYVNFREGAPDEGQPLHDCIELDHDHSDGLWADVSCSDAQNYICELSGP